MSIAGHELPNYRIAVVGAGAVGGFYGGRLAQYGRDVHFLMRSDHDHVKKHGLRIRSKQGDAHVPNARVYRHTEEIGPCDLVIIALKATNNEEFLAEHFGAERVLGGLCFVCINRTGPGEIHHIAEGRIVLGEFGRFVQPRTHEIASEFKRCGIVCSVAESLGSARWKKLVWNIPFNGLSIAAGAIDTSAILASDALEELVRALMHEIIETARHLGHELSFSIIDTMVNNTRRMGAYKPSSLIDFLDGREVEIDAIWGEPCRRAFNARHAMPRVEALHLLLKHLAASRTPSSQP